MSTAIRSPIALFASPWPYIGVGFLLTVAGAGIYQAGLGLVVGSITLLLGLFLVGVGTSIRLQAPEKQDFATIPAFRNPARLLVTLFQIGVIAIFSWMLLAAILGIDPFGRNPPNLNVPMNIKIGPMVIAWLLVVPLTILSLRTIWRGPISGSIESGLMLAIVCVTVVVAGRSVPVAADTLRFFLAVLALAIAFGVSLLTAPVGVRYAVLSIFAVLHFLGIITATLATPPTPWLATQVWHRLAHPYLEFMYLNNAYHFYSPEPGATTHFWLCVYYDTGKKDEAGDPIADGVWVKIPEVDEQGRNRYPVALEYQRMLSLNENIVTPDIAPSLYIIDDKGQILPGPLLKDRLLNSTTGAQWRGTVIGRDTEPTVEVPMVPGLAPDAQYQKPSAASMRLMESYLRYAARKKHPEHPEWPVLSVRAYRAMHTIPAWYVFKNGGDPNDPSTFRPIFNGTFDPKYPEKINNPKAPLLFNPNERLLNWMLPSLRGQPEHPDSPVFCWYLLHAGERRFIYRPDTKEYVRLTPDLLPKFPREWTENLHKYVPPEWVKDWKP